MNILLNKKIEEIKNDIIPSSHLIEVELQGDSGLILCCHPSLKLHGLFADMGDGNYFSVTGWVKNKS
tara:strand:- start:664 stop:864 length:201 start_codon:yes stop_codon:yes gene_type:complete